MAPSRSSGEGSGRTGADPGPGNQINDFNPGIASSGLFWTTAIAPESIDANPGNGAASMQVSDLAVTDYGNIVNALFGGGPAPMPATVSFDVRWSGALERANIVNPDNGFAGEFVRGHAQMEMVGDGRRLLVRVGAGRDLVEHLRRDRARKKRLFLPARVVVPEGL